MRKLDSYAAVEHPLRLALRASDSRRAVLGDYFTVAEEMGTDDLAFSNSHLLAIDRNLVALPGRCRFGSFLRTPIVGSGDPFVNRYCLQSTDLRAHLLEATFSYPDESRIACCRIILPGVEVAWARSLI